MRPRLHLLRDPYARRGLLDMLAVAPGMAAWGVVTGVAMVKSGLSVPLAIFMSLVVYAGSAQFAALPLLAAGAPLWVVCAAACCVNLRFLIYSAQWRRYFGHLPRAGRVAIGYFSADINMVVFQKAWPELEPRPGQLPYFIAGAVGIWCCWQGSSIAGIFLADAIPATWGLEFAGTLAMLGLALGLLTDRGTWVAAVVAGSAAVAAYALPLKLNILVAIAAAVAAGLLAEQAGRAGGAHRRRPA